MLLEIVNPALVGGGIAALMFLGILLFLRLGRRLGRRAIARAGEDPASIGSLERAQCIGVGRSARYFFGV